MDHADINKHSLERVEGSPEVRGLEVQKLFLLDLKLNGFLLQAVMHPSLAEHVLHTLEFRQDARIFRAITQNHYGALESGCCNDLAPILPN